MSDRSIEITVPADFTKGKLTVEVNGVVGPSCKSLTQNLEAALGAEDKVEQKDAFNQVARVKNQQQAGRG